MLSMYDLIKGHSVYGIATNRLVVFSICLFIFLVSFLFGADFGKFEPDYFAAHSITMRHLHGPGDILNLLRTIPNSASGVLPLWLFGFVGGIFTHKLLSLCIFLTIIGLIWHATKPDDYGYYFILGALLSPMMMSATAWVLPELFALLLVVLFCKLTKNHRYVALMIAPLVPLSRQTFIVFLGARLLFLPKNLGAYLLGCVLAAGALGGLAYVWGGLVPPRLAGVHLTPSLKPAIVSFLIFTLYFAVHSFRVCVQTPFNRWRAAGSILASIVAVIVGLNADPLLGGGYIFSRLELLNLPLAVIIEITLISTFLYANKLSTIGFVLISSISFSTTNYMFLKYIDFYFFAFLSYGLSDIGEQYKKYFLEYAYSGLIFQIFSLTLALVYYF